MPVFVRVVFVYDTYYGPPGVTQIVNKGVHSSSIRQSSLPALLIPRFNWKRDFQFESPLATQKPWFKIRSQSVSHSNLS